MFSFSVQGTLHNRSVLRRLLEQWRRPQFARSTQQTLRRLEAGHFSEASKRELILSALYSDNPAQYLTIVVCRWSLELPTNLREVSQSQCQTVCQCV